MDDQRQMRVLDPATPIWDRYHTVSSLVVVGTREADGGVDLAPKHLAMPMAWTNLFGFICTPLHGTYRNVERDGVFTVSVPRPGQVVLAALGASPRCDDGTKPELTLLPTSAATVVDGVVLDDAVAVLECELDRIVEGLDSNALVVGRVVAARVAPDALRDPEIDDLDLLGAAPLLAYLHPWRYAVVDRSSAFPRPQGMRR